MIVDGSFSYHSLSLTIMFAIKRSMIVHDSLSKSRKSPTACDCKQMWRGFEFRDENGCVWTVYQPRRAAIATILVTVM